MYYEGIEPYLNNLEDKNIGIAGGSVVAMAMSSINSLIIYICNLTIGKKKYMEVEDKVSEILSEANTLKTKTLQFIDDDKAVLDKILTAYKNRMENPNAYYQACKDGVDFCLEVLETSVAILQLAEKISLYGNRMLSSDFQICAHLGLASVKSSIVNVNINLIEELGAEYTECINRKCQNLLNEAVDISERIIENSK